MSITEALFEKGLPVPAKIELLESSGPVSPAYQFSTHVIISTDGNAAILSYDDRREYRQGKPQKEISFKKELTRAQYEELWSNLSRLQVFERSRDFIGPENRKRIGVSFNFFEISLGDRRSRCDYLLSKAKDPEFEPFLKIIDQLKELRVLQA